MRINALILLSSVLALSAMATDYGSPPPPPCEEEKQKHQQTPAATPAVYGSSASGKNLKSSALLDTASTTTRTIMDMTPSPTPEMTNYNQDLGLDGSTGTLSNNTETVSQTSGIYNTNAGLMIMDMMKTIPYYDSNATETCSNGSYITYICFKTSCDPNVCAKPPNQARTDFVSAFLDNLVQALGDRNINITLDSVSVLNLGPVENVTAVQLAFLSDKIANVKKVVTEFATQLNNTASPLNTLGSKAAPLDPTVFAMSVVDTPSNDLGAPQPSKTPLSNAAIAGVACAGAVAMALAAFGLYKAKKGRASSRGENFEGGLDGRRSGKLSALWFKSDEELSVANVDSPTMSKHFSYSQHRMTAGTDDFLHPDEVVVSGVSTTAAVGASIEEGHENYLNRASAMSGESGDSLPRWNTQFRGSDELNDVSSELDVGPVNPYKSAYAESHGDFMEPALLQQVRDSFYHADSGSFVDY